MSFVGLYTRWVVSTLKGVLCERILLHTTTTGEHILVYMNLGFLAVSGARHTLGPHFPAEIVLSHTGIGHSVCIALLIQCLRLGSHGTPHPPSPPLGLASALIFMFCREISPKIINLVRRLAPSNCVCSRWALACAVPSVQRVK